MAKIYWTNGSGGDFATTSNWSTDTVPGASDIANLNAAGTYTVTSEVDQTVLAVTTASTATLDLTNGWFTALAGTGPGANAGTIKVEADGTFLTGGTLDNKGTIAVNGSDATWLLVRDTTVAGGGDLSLSDSFIEDRNNTLTFTNVDNTISGAGSIYVMHLVNEALGVIDANGTDPLSITTWGGGPGTVANTGTLEATGQGGLDIYNNLNNVGGVIKAVGIGSVVSLEPGLTITGGTFQTANGGVIQAEGGSNAPPSPGGSLILDGTNGNTLTNAGILSIPNDDWLTLQGILQNTGTIQINADAHDRTGLVVGAGGATLSGSGVLTMSNNVWNFISGNDTSTKLTNSSTISGAGTIGGDGLVLVNQGVIDGNDSNPLIVDTGANAVTNSGTMEATAFGTLYVASNVTNTGHLIANNGDVIFAGAVSGTGTTTIQGAGSVEFGSTTTSNTTFAAGADGTVTFDAASTLTGKLSITGFTLGDTIDLADINFVGSGPTLTFSKGVLTVSDGTHVAKLHMIGSYTLANFHASSDGSGGTLITDPPATSSHSANIALNENPTNYGVLATDLSTTSTTQQDTSGNMPVDTFIFPPNLGQHSNVETANDQIQLPHSELLAAVSADVHHIGQDVGVVHDASGLDHVLASHLHTAQNSHLV